MLLQLRDYIKRMKLASSEQIAREFHLDESALEPMLAIWVKKGVIQVSQETAACDRGCQSCRSKRPVFYCYSN